MQQISVPGDPWAGVNVSRINNAGQIIGTTYHYNSRAFLMDQGQPMQALGTLGGNNSSGSDINNSGQIVGAADISGNVSHAFIKNSVQTMQDLNALTYNLPQGVTLTQASAINDKGYILGQNSLNHAFLLRPQQPNGIPDISPQKIYIPYNDGWINYNVSFQEQQMMINLNIKLVGDEASNELKNIWKNKIWDVWSNRYEIKDGNNKYPIIFNVNWVNNNPDATVTVHNGTGQFKTYNWYTNFAWYSGWPDNKDYWGRAAAHEVGHILGIYDEYSGGTLNPVTKEVDDGYIMGKDLSPLTADRYYEEVLNWLMATSGRNLSLIDANLPTYPFEIPPQGWTDISDAPQVPIPSTLVLLGSGVLGLMGWKRIKDSSHKPS